MLDTIPTTTIDRAPVFVPLWSPSEYKFCRGGRGSGKSHDRASHLVSRMASEKIRWLCVREVQLSMRDSVHQLLSDKITAAGLDWAFEVQRDRIICTETGSTCAFRGMQSFNADNIKSFEDLDGVWWEEAQTASERSLRLLRPTIRENGAEIWFTYNPRYESDAVEKLRLSFHEAARLGEDVPSFVDVKANWRDNPWWTDKLEKERKLDRVSYPDLYDHTWEGGYEIITEATYYARHLQRLEADGAIGADFTHDPDLPVDTAWDLGVDDYTSIWFLQNDGRKVWVVDFYETQGDGAQQIVADALPELNPDMELRYRGVAEMGRARPYRYGVHYLPHDVTVRDWGNGARKRIEVLERLGLRNISTGVPAHPHDRVEAVRRLLPYCRFSAAKRVEIGLTHLRRYSRKWNEQVQQYMGPLKDGHDHAADAFGEYAINCPIYVQPEPKPKPRKQEFGSVYLPGRPTPKTGPQRIQL